MQRREYTILHFTKSRNDIDDLNRMGADGWEAVSMAATWGVSEKRLAHPIIPLKRALPNGADSKP